MKIGIFLPSFEFDAPIVMVFLAEGRLTMRSYASNEPAVKPSRSRSHAWLGFAFRWLPAAQPAGGAHLETGATYFDAPTTSIPKNADCCAPTGVVQPTIVP